MIMQSVRLENLRMNIWRRSFIILALMVVFVAIYSSSFLFRDYFFNFVSSVAEYIDGHEVLGALVFVFVAALSAILSPLSSIPIVPSAVMVWGNVLTAILLMAGWTIGAVWGYMIGCYAEERFMKKYLSLEKINQYKDKISPRSQFWLVLIFRLAIPSEITGYTLGIVHYHFWKYLLATVISEIPFVIATIYSSELLINGRLITFIAVILAVIIFMIITAHYFVEFGRRRKEIN